MRVRGRTRRALTFAAAATMVGALTMLGGVMVGNGPGRAASTQPASGGAGASGGYTPQRWSCLGEPENPDGTTSGREGAGQLDAHGVLWQLCGDHVLRDDGHPVATLPFPAQDLAPSPDGTRVYLMQAQGPVRRMLVAPDGSLVDDPDWHLDTFTSDGTAHTAGGWGLATDWWGDIYVSNGGWRSGQPPLVLKYGPDGHLKASFGSAGTGDGQFNTNMGLGVSPDGRMVYVADHLNCRVQRFDYRDAVATYRYATQWGGCDTDNETPGKFSAVYDVALDRQGYVYVADATWNRIQRFTGDGTYVEQLLATPFATAQSHVHFVTVDAPGNVYVGQTDQRWTRTVPDTAPTPTPLPLTGPDTSAPTIDAVGIPAVVSTTSFPFTFTAHDDHAVDVVRMTGPDGAWGAWIPYQQVLAATIRQADGAQQVQLQVRDAAGNESAVWTSTVALPAAPAPAPAPKPPVDRAAPTITVAKVVLRRGTATLAVHAVDARSAPVQLRHRLGNGRWSSWQRARGSERLPVPAGVRDITIEARDAAGNSTAPRRIRLPKGATTVVVASR